MKKLLLFLLSISFISMAYADYGDGWNAFERGDYKTAFNEWEPLANQGDVDAQKALGMMFFLHDLDEGVVQDDVKAVYWYRKAAEQGDALAQDILDWYRRTAEQGDVDAQQALDRIIGVTKKKELAEAKVKEAEKKEALNVFIVKSEENAFPIVISPFEVVGNAEQGATIANIIRDNLNRSGQFSALSSSNVITNKIDFSYWKNQGKDAIVFGKVEEVSSKVFNVTVYVYDISTKKQLYAKTIEVHNSGIRRISHYLSDKIYNILLGQKGAFDTRLTYVTVTDDKKLGKVYQLEISDSDGQNAQVVIKSLYPILSPAWSPDQNKIAYVSFQNGRSEVFIKYPFMRVKSIKIPQFDGISSAPSWHPNGQGLALTMSRKGNIDIYFYSLKSKKLDRLTKNVAIDTEANFSPDGNSIAFTSNRSGQTQIYIKNLVSGKTELVPIDGTYNAEPVFSPDGKQLAFIHRVGKDDRLALFDIASRNLTVLTLNKLDESPYFSPNGGMIIFATNRNNKGVLSVISLYNNQIVELAQKGVEVREPSWSNYSN